VTSFSFKTLLKNAEDFTALPAGDYNCFVETAEAVTASTGKPMIKVTYRVEDGPKKGKKVFNNFVISVDNGQALGFFFRNMAAHGLARSWFENDPSMELVAQNLVGKRVRLRLGIRNWQGEDRNEVKAIAPPEGAQAVAGVPGLPGDTVTPTQTTASNAPSPSSTTQQPVGGVNNAPAPELPF